MSVTIETNLVNGFYKTTVTCSENCVRNTEGEFTCTSCGGTNGEYGMSKTEAGGMETKALFEERVLAAAAYMQQQQ